MLNEIEEHVQHLHEYLTSQNSDTLCRSLISDINLKCGEEINEQTISFCLSIFFKKDKNILTFLRKSISKDDLKATKVELLQFLYRFISSADKLIVPHTIDIVQTCMILFNSDKYSDVRCSVFPILAKSFELSSQNSEVSCKIETKKIVDDFYTALGTPSKLSSSIKANIFSLLGLMCQYYPVDMIRESEKILEAFVNTLKTELGSRINHKPDHTVISGTLEGLNSYLNNFTHSAQEGAKYSHQIFKFINDALQENKDLSRFQMPKAALGLLTKHAEQFDEYLFDDYESLFKRLSYWATHKNYDMKKMAYFALDSFYKQLAGMLEQKCKSDSAKSRVIFNFFIRKFMETLVSKCESNIKETVVAIKGYGAFASPCKEFLTNDDVKRMLTIVIERCEKIYFLKADEIGVEAFDEKIYQLPSFIDSLSLICDQIEGDLPEGCVATIEKLVILAIDSYPKLFKQFSTQLFLAMSKILVSLQLVKKIDDFVPRIVYFSLIRVFSYKTNYLIEQADVLQDVSLTSSAEYIGFWSSMLSLSKFDDSKGSSLIKIEQRKELTHLLYDQFVDSLLKITKKLDLSSTKDTHDPKDEDLFEENSSKPTKPKDFEILINLVDFSKEILLNYHQDLFGKWLAKFSREMIVLSDQYPLISGFYKLNTTCIKIAVKIGYFTQSLADYGEHLQAERQNCFELYKKYSYDVSMRMKQFKDELLVSCLEYILSQPKQLIEINLTQIFSALENALDLGLTYMPIAKTALDTVEYSLNTIDLTILIPYFARILVKFESYLQISYIRETNVEEKMVKKEQKSVGLRNRLINKSIKKMREAKNINEMSLLDEIQFRILKIIGQNAGEMRVFLYKSCTNDEIISWDTYDHLKFSVPFVDIKPNIFFDKFLPRIIYLALSSTNRQLKVNACELLHAIVVYSIGKNVTDPLSKTSDTHQMTKIYSHLYPALFRLACDVDQFVRNLFQPLVMQIIHWFTGNRTYENRDTVVLLDCIMDCLIDEKNALLREFSAVALKEFFKWSLKHTPSAQQDEEKSQINAKSILKRIFNLITHPSSVRRLGAAHAWNSIYIIFREETYLVDKYIFELLYHFIDGLAMAQHDDKTTGTQEHIKLALDHIERIIVVKKDLLNQINPKRVKPHGWSEAVVEVAVRWLMRQCGRSQIECRHKAMELVVKLAPCIRNIKTTKDYFNKKLECVDNLFEVYFIERFEGAVNKQSLSSYPCLNDVLVDSIEPSAQALLWLEMFIATLDCYTWVFSESLLTPSSLFSRGKSIVWTSMKNFIDKVVLHEFDFVTVKKEFTYLRCTAIVRLFDCVTCVMGKFSSLNELEIGCCIRDVDFFNENFYRLIICLCLDPQRLGFEITDLETFRNLPLISLNFLKQFTKIIQSTQREQQFKHFCTSSIDANHEFSRLDLLLVSNDINWIQVSQILIGYDTLNHLRIYHMQPGFLQNLFNLILKSCTNNDQKSCMIQEAKSKILGIIFKCSETLVYQVLDSLFVQDSDKMRDFMRYFKNEVFESVLKSEKIFEFIFLKLNIAFSNVLILVMQLIDFVYGEKLLRKLYAPKLVQQLFEKWSQINAHLNNNEEDIQNKKLALSLLTKILLIADSNSESEATFEFYFKLLLDDHTKLNFKCNVLDLLPYFASINSHEKFSIKQLLENFVSKYFPLSSQELINAGDAFDDYSNAIKKMLVAMELSLSFDVCQVLLGLFIREKNHLLDDEAQKSFLFFIHRLEPKKQTHLLNFYWEKYFLNTNAAQNERKRNLFEKFFGSFLLNSHKSSFSEFINTNLIKIIKMTDLELLAHDPNINVLLDERRFAYILIENVFKRCTKEEVFSQHAKICQIYETHKYGSIKDGKEFVKELIRKLRKQLAEVIKIPSGDNLANESLRLLNCSAYNCLVALFIRTQTEPKLYNACLFKDDSSKNEFIFEPLINKTKVYRFSIEIADAYQRKTRLVSLRAEFKENTQMNDNGSTTYITSLGESSVQQSVFASSQNLYGSSLSEELSAFDYTSYSRQSQSLNRLGTKTSTTKKVDDVKTSKDDDQIVELDMDELNRHESMISFVELIQSLVKNKVTPIYDNDQMPNELPPWMQFLNRKTCSLTTHENVKLFIIRGIVNTSSVFTKYAKFWYSSLINFLIDSQSLCADGCIDYFTLDLLVLLLSWHKIALPELSEKVAVNQIYEKLIKACFNDNRGILKNNLELIKAVTECWKHLIEVPVEEIHKFIKKDELKQISVGIQLFGFCLSNNINSYNYPDGMTYQEFFKTLLDHCIHKSKLIHSTASEIIGMLLTQLNRNSLRTEELENTLKYYYRIITPATHSIMILSVYRVHLNYASIVDPFLNKLLFLLPQVVGEFKLMCAECILSSIKILEEALWKRSYFVEMLTHRDAQLQLVCLRIVYELLDKMSHEDFEKLIDILCNFINHPNLQCRYQVTLILMELYDKKEKSPDEMLFKKCRNSLLKLLMDNDQLVRLSAFNFWTDKSHTFSSNTTIDRIVAILCKMYSPETELEYLSYSTNLLLEKTSKSPDYNRLIFENPLSECAFKDYNLSTDWRRRHEMMTPQFINTFSQSQSSVDQITTMMNSQVDVPQQTRFLRSSQQTLALNFTPTQGIQTQAKTPYDWITQSTLNTQAETKMMLSGKISFKLSKIDNQEDADINLLRRRFRVVPRDKEEETKFFAKLQIDRQKRDDDARKLEKLKRQGQIEKYRQYRIGDFPDIQIKYSEIIAPLQALAQRDAQIAMCLFKSLFSSIISEISYLKDDRESHEIMLQVCDSLNCMLSNSESTNPTFIACLIEMSIKHSRNFQLNSSYVSNACLNSGQQPLGIILFEEYLLAQEDLPLGTKRVKSNSGKAMNSDTHLWIELAKLYRSINDYDSVKGIFTRNSSLITDHTREAFNYESNCDYSNASICYKDALNLYSSDDGVLEIEKELWQQSLLRCLSELTDWKGICDTTVKKDSLLSLYKDDYKAEHLFPYAFHSKIKLISTENSIEEQQKHGDLVDFINCLSSGDKETLEALYSQDLAMFYLHQRDLNACKYYTQLTLNKYLTEWSSRSKTTINGRMAKVNSLQSAVELNEFLKFIDKNEKLVSVDQLETVVKHLNAQWLNSMPNLLSDSPQTWDNIITNRCLCYEFIEDENKHLFDSQIRESVDKAKLEMKLKFATAAYLQGNYMLVLEKLQQNRSILKQTSESFIYLKQIWMNVYLKTHLTNIQICDSLEKRFENLVNTGSLMRLREYDSNACKLDKTHVDLYEDHFIIKSKYCSFILDIFLNMDGTIDLIHSIKSNPKMTQQFFSFINHTHGDAQSIACALLTQGFESLSKITLKTKGNLELGKYADKYLRRLENDTSDSDQSILSNARIYDKYPQVVVKQLLIAIKHGSYDARQRFPRLLQIVELYPHLTQDLFILESNDVPCWMFLGWLSQITAMLDKPESKALEVIVEKIAMNYPQALIYPFKISSESYKSTTREQSDFISKISKLMNRLTIVDQFINALEQLTNPEINCRDFLSVMHNNAKNRGLVSNTYRELRASLIDLNTKDELVNDCIYGKIKQNFALKFKWVFDQELGNDDSIKKLSDEDLKVKIQMLLTRLSSFSSQTGNLGDYSNWLKNFKRNRARDLEMPGQYTGKNKPLTEYHIKIESFDERMLVLNTLRKPKMIIIRGNDERDHKFLVKSGEDQRQDQRIECLFELINDLLRSDPHCYQNHYSIRTYQVTPMTTKLALIEWIENTKTFKDAIFSSLTDEENRRVRPSELKGSTVMFQLYQKYIQDASRDPRARLQDQYGAIFSNISSKEVESKFNTIKSYIPNDLFRRFLSSMSLNTDGYFILRNHFITSYSIASICQYILGIGDRHLSNWMIDTKSGQAIGIDFGMAFGHATLQLPIPELVPLRLTDQLIHIMAPLGHHGLLEATMMHILRALRKNNDLLLCTLNVFIKEPSVDWIGSAQRIANKKFGELSMSNDETKNFALNRIKSVKAKLDGNNPALITRNDLAYGIHKDSKYLSFYINAVLGTEGMLRTKFIREKGEKYQLSYEEQVKCIIEQSMDINILGRMWNGWEPYI